MYTMSNMSTSISVSQTFYPFYPPISFMCRADIMSKLNFLRDTKLKCYTLHNTAVLAEDMINLHFTL